MTQLSASYHQESSPALDSATDHRLRGVIARLRRFVLIEGVAWVMVSLFIASVLQFVVDYSTRGLQWSMRAAILAIIVIVVARVAWKRLIVPLRMDIGIAEVARLIERRYPELASLLITAVRFAAGDVGASASNSPQLVSSVIHKAGSRMAKVDFDVVINPQRAKKSGAMIAAVMLVSMGSLMISPETVGLWFSRNILLQNIEWPRRTTLMVDLQDGKLIGARGDDLVVEATAIGSQPRVVEFFYETKSGQRGRETMLTIGSEGSYRYRYTLKNAQENFTFYLEGGDHTTESFDAQLIDRPSVRHTRIHIVPPAYTKMDPVKLGDGQRAAQILPGSVVTIEMETNKPVERATLMADRDVIAQATGLSAATDSATAEDSEIVSKQYSVTFTPTKTLTYHFALKDHYGLDNRRPVRFSLRLIKDDSPLVRLKLPGVGEMITPDAILPIEVEFSDTYGLASAELVYQVLREASVESLIDLPTFKASATRFESSVTWPVAAAAPVAGERLSLLARATDFDSVSGPNVTQTPETTLRVVTREELMAELGRREQEYRMDFERLIDAQEQLRGQLLTIIGRSNTPGAKENENLAADLAPLERRQRNIASSVNVIRQQFEQILLELRVNQLATHEVEKRLGERIVEPLTKLSKRDLVAAADTIRQWSRNLQAETASKIDPQQVGVVAQMREILKNMIQWEGYQEVVNMLRDIVRLQNDLSDETKKALEDQAKDIFDD